MALEHRGDIVGVGDIGYEILDELHGLVGIGIFVGEMVDNCEVVAVGHDVPLDRRLW